MCWHLLFPGIQLVHRLFILDRLVNSVHSQPAFPQQAILRAFSKWKVPKSQNDERSCRAFTEKCETDLLDGANDGIMEWMEPMSMI